MGEAPAIELEDLGSKGRYLVREPGGAVAEMTFSKAGERMIAGALRLELCGRPVRVCEIAPGMVHTEEFSLTRLGDQARADAVYAGVPDPLVAEDIAEVVAWVASRPPRVNVDRIVVRPRAQAANHKLYRVV